MLEALGTGAPEVQRVSSTKSSETPTPTPPMSSLAPTARSTPLRPVSAPPSFSVNNNTGASASAISRTEDHETSGAGANAATVSVTLQSSSNKNNTSAAAARTAGNCVGSGQGPGHGPAQGPCSQRSLSPTSEACTPVHVSPSYPNSYQVSVTVSIRSELLDAASSTGSGLSGGGGANSAVVTRVIPAPLPSPSSSQTPATMSQPQVSHALAQRTSSKDSCSKGDGCKSNSKCKSTSSSANAASSAAGPRPPRVYRFADVLARSVREHPFSKALEALLAHMALYRIPILLIAGLLLLDTVILLVIQVIDPPRRSNRTLQEQPLPSPEELQLDIRYRYA